MARDKKPQLTKDDIDARLGLSARQARVAERRKTKVTGQDVERLLAERKAARSERRDDPQRRSAVRRQAVSVGTGVVLALGCAAMATAISGSTDSFEEQREVNALQIAALRGELAEQPGLDAASATAYTEDLTAQIETATTLGEEVAALQNTFADLLYGANTEVSSDGAPSPSFLASVEHRKALAPYFVPDALFVEDDVAYAPGSLLPFAPDEIDPRFPWHVTYVPGSNGAVVADPSLSRWSLVSVTLTPTPGVLDVTWLDRDTTNDDLLAWATASFYVEPGGFGSLMVGRTTIGERSLTQTDTQTTPTEGA